MREIVKRETIETSIGEYFKLLLWWQWRGHAESKLVA